MHIAHFLDATHFVQMGHKWGFAIHNHHKCLSYIFLINSMAITVRGSTLLIRIRRLQTKVDPRAVRVKYMCPK